MLWTFLAVLFMGNGFFQEDAISAGVAVLCACLAVRGAVMRWDKPGALVSVAITAVAGILFFVQLSPDGEGKERPSENLAEQTTREKSASPPREARREYSAIRPVMNKSLGEMELTKPTAGLENEGLSFGFGSYGYADVVNMGAPWGGHIEGKQLNFEVEDGWSKPVERPEALRGMPCTVHFEAHADNPGADVYLDIGVQREGDDGWMEYARRVHNGDESLRWEIQRARLRVFRGVIGGVRYSWWCKAPDKSAESGRPGGSALVDEGRYVRVRSRPGMQVQADVPFDKPAGCMVQISQAYSTDPLSRDATYAIEYREASASSSPYSSYTWKNYEEHLRRGAHVWGSEILRATALSGKPIVNYSLYCQDDGGVGQAPAVPVPFGKKDSSGMVTGETTSGALDIPNNSACYLRLEYTSLNDVDNISVQFALDSGKTLWAEYKPFELFSTEGTNDVRIRIESGQYRDMAYSLACKR